MTDAQLQRIFSLNMFTVAGLGLLVASTPGCASEAEGDPLDSQAGAMSNDPPTGPSSTNGPTTSTGDGPVASPPPPNGMGSGGSGATGGPAPVDQPTSPGASGGAPPDGASGSGAGGSGASGGANASGAPGEGGTPGGGGAPDGAAGMGGSSEGGASGSSAGEASDGGAAGAPVNSGSDDSVVPSAGCGADPPASERYSIDVGGMMRDYILLVPENYDPEKPYRLIFGWHPWGGSAQQVAGNGASGYYGLQGASGGEAILVSPEGLDFGGNGLGWGNEGGQDIEFLRAMIDRFDSELCFDHNRMFSTGFSFGGMMSNAVACSGLARAVAPMAGNSSVSGCEDGSQPVAYMGFHGDADSVVAISGGEMARDVMVERNGCGAATASESDWCELAGDNYQPCTCTSYEGCQDGYPVTWCQFTGNHMPAPNSGETIWNFFSQF